MVDNYVWGIDTAYSGSAATVSDSLIEGVKVEVSDTSAGYGLITQSGASINVDNLAIVATEGAASGGQRRRQFRQRRRLPDR